MKDKAKENWKKAGNIALEYGLPVLEEISKSSNKKSYSKGGRINKVKHRAKTEEGSGYGIMSNDFPEKF